MNKILIRHLSGDRAQQADEFAAFGFRELIVGRDPAAQVRFDPDKDDLVSRQHLKIMADPTLPNSFQVVDLQSRNGTFLNRQRVFGSQRVSSGDVIQLGPGGPEIRFELDPPPPPSAAMPTRDSATGFGSVLRPTRETLPPPHGMSSELNAPRPVGRATVERMLGDAFTRVSGESRKGLWIGVAALVAILAVGGGTWHFMRQSAADAAAAQREIQTAQREGQAGLKQVSEELSKNPALVKSMRDEIARLQAQLRSTQESNDRAMKSLSTSISRVGSQVEANKQVIVQQAPPPPAQQAPQQQTQVQREAPPPPPPPQQTTQPIPHSPPGQPPPSEEEFTRLTAEATQFIDQNKTADAMNVAQKLIRMDPNRFEGYALGGISAYLGNQFAQAVSLLQQAAAKAPPERKQQYEDLARQCQQAMSAAEQQ